MFHRAIMDLGKRNGDCGAPIAAAIFLRSSHATEPLACAVLLRFDRRIIDELKKNEFLSKAILTVPDESHIFPPHRTDEFTRVARRAGNGGRPEGVGLSDQDNSDERRNHVMESASGIIGSCGPRSERSAWMPSSASKSSRP